MPETRLIHLPVSDQGRVFVAVLNSLDHLPTLAEIPQVNNTLPLILPLNYPESESAIMLWRAVAGRIICTREMNASDSDFNNLSGLFKSVPLGHTDKLWSDVDYDVDDMLIFLIAHPQPRSSRAIDRWLMVSIVFMNADRLGMQFLNVKLQVEPPPSPPGLSGAVSLN